VPVDTGLAAARPRSLFEQRQECEGGIRACQLAVANYLVYRHVPIKGFSTWAAIQSERDEPQWSSSCRRLCPGPTNIAGTWTGNQNGPMRMDGTLLQAISEHARELQRERALPGIAVGMPELDRQLWQHGRQWLERRGFGVHGRRPPRDDGPDVYLATDVYREGGHTALIGDLIAARRDGNDARLILTGVSAENAQGPSSIILRRLGIGAEKITVLNGATLDERLDQLFEQLIALRPRHLFLIQHGHDPLPVVVAQPAICERRILIHHTDATPSLGLYIPGVAIVDLNPWAAAMSRVQRLRSELLLLTCSDPGPRTTALLSGERLTTASSGSAQKFASDYVYSYPEVVVAILEVTGGRHVHIGQLSDETLAATTGALSAAGIEPGRFVHCGVVPSVAQALWDHRCDIFIASFPVDGARTLAEVAASGTPYVAHSTTPLALEDDLALGIPGAVRWHTLRELTAAVRAMTDRSVLEEKARLVRDAYLRLHHPNVFRANLEAILADRGGVEDPDADYRDKWAFRMLTRALTHAIVDMNHQALVRARGFAGEIALSRKKMEKRMDASVSRLEMEIANTASRLADVMNGRQEIE